MNQKWINKQQNASCILFFNGWGMDENSILQIDNEGFDVYMINDFISFEPVTENLSAYNSITVIAWSLGVWAAEQILSISDIKVDQYIAINGTSNPLSDLYGIPEKVFLGTLHGWNESNKAKFIRRMMGGRLIDQNYDCFLSKRSLESQEIELLKLYESFKGQNRAIAWNKAIVGQIDLIFPAGNQINWWNGKVPIIETYIPHFPFLEVEKWDQLLSL